jgi:hypothetical protein
VRTPVTASLAFLLLIAAACGGGNPSVDPSGSASGNWQVDLLQNYPGPQTQLSVSGFLVETNNALTGSVQGPTVFNPSGVVECGGIGQLTGTISGQNVTFSVGSGGTVFNFTGMISPDHTSMSGDYQALAGACFSQPTSGTWNAFLIPPLNGSFTGTLSDSQYMETLTGLNPAAPISVSGTLSQTPNVGANNAGLTGTITAVGYPCFAKASLTGTISGSTVVLSVYGYNGDLIGSIGLGAPAIAAATSSGASLTAAPGGLKLGPINSNILTLGPCPVIQSVAGPTTDDSTAVALTFQ